MLNQLINCIHIVCKNKDSIAFCDGEAGVQFNDIIFVPIACFKRSSIYTDTTYSVDNFDFEASFHDEIISDDELTSGKFDGAEVNIYIYDTLNAKVIMHHKGFMNIVKMRDGAFKAEIRGVMDLLNRTIGECYSPQCRANFGDDRCKVVTDTLKISMEVISHDRLSNWLTLDTKLNMNDFRGGTISASGATYQIVDAFDNQVQILNPYNQQIEDTIECIPGCDKSFSTCYEKWNNAVNFRGEPHLKDVQNLG